VLEIDDLIRQISAKQLYDHIAYLSGLGPRLDGSPAELKAAKYITRNLEQYGLEVQRLSLPTPVIADRLDRLEALTPEYFEITCVAHMRAGLTPPAGITAELVYVGKGFESDYTNRDVAGKIALAYESQPYEGEAPGQIGWHLDKIRRAVKYGAKAVIFCTQRGDSHITTWGLWGLDERIDEVPSVGIGFPDLVRLRKLAQQKAVQVRLISTGQIQQGYSDVIWATAPGTCLPEEVILLIGGHKETVPSCPGANDNASGNAILLELMRVFAQNKPEKTIIGMVTCGEESGCWGGKAYLQQYRDWLQNRLKLVITFDQVISGDVRLVGQGNDRYNQLMIETAAELGYHLGLTNDPANPVASGLADSEPFVEAGFPGIMLGGWWSDPFYHCNGDTLDKVNPNFVKVWADVIGATTLKVCQLH
jgi:aminopeptidase YwaD